METETVKGDLKGAIEQYRRIASQTRDRAIAATALVRMAECYQKLGDSQARSIYERVARDYSDQKDAVAIARARLGGSPGATTASALALRKVWTDPAGDCCMFGGISPDGRYLTYAGQYNTAVVLRDLVAGTERTLIEKGGTVSSAISKDGTQVAYDWCVGSQGTFSDNDATCQLWVSPLHGSAGSPGRRVYRNPDVSSLRVHDWSPDSKRVAVVVQRQDRTSQIGWVAVDDGSLHVLKSIEWRGTQDSARVFFSPDGRNLAFDLPENERTDDRDVFVIAVDGSREVPAAVTPGNDVVVGWAPDGRQLLFASDRRGSMDLWAQPFIDGRPQGSPAVLKPHFGNVIPLGITRSGALYMAAALWDEDIEIAPVDLTTGKSMSPVRPIRQFVGTNSQPAWSPDGTRLAYRSARRSSLATGAGFGEGVLAIRSIDSGETVELQPALTYSFNLTWTPDGQALVVQGADRKGREGIFRVSTRGEVTPLIVPLPEGDKPGYEGLFFTADGKRLIYRTQKGRIHERDLASLTDRILARGRWVSAGAATADVWGPISVSPDGRWVAAETQPEGEAFGPSRALTIIPADGGEPRVLLRVSEPMLLYKDVPWTPDSRSLIVMKGMVAAGGLLDPAANELWCVPIDGTAARRLDLDATRVLMGGVGRIRLHPDGHRLTYVSGRYPVAEVWALENFLPAAGAKKP
jgi:Tol biopolymer transport system component